MRLLAASVLVALACGPVHANTYYVRPDGGTLAQCNGTVNQPYRRRIPSLRPGQPPHSDSPLCAWASPMVALPATYYGQPHNPPARIHSHDTLVVESGTYPIGWNPVFPIPGSEACNAGNIPNCVMQAPPDDVEIVGDTSSWPVLELIAGAYSGFNIGNTNNVEIAYFEITDLQACKIAFFDPAYSCPANSGEWGANGIVGTDASNVWMHHLNIHDLANEGVRIGRINGLMFTDFQVIGNAEAGIDMDCSNGGQVPCSNSGTLLFENGEIAWNGCVRDLDGFVIECEDQDHGGYGDGFGTWHTGGNFVFDNVYFHHNLSDGGDCLYVDQPDSSCTFDHVTSYANAGNQLKAAGTVTIENSIIDSNCAEPWSLSPPNNQNSGVPVFEGMYGVDLAGVCRATGAGISLSIQPFHTINIWNNTATTQSSCIITTVTQHSGDSEGAVVNYANNILEGDFNIDWQNFATGGGAQLVCGQFDYTPTGQAPNDPTNNWSHNIVWGVKGNQCPGDSLCLDPMLTGDSPVDFNPVLLPGSPAFNHGDQSVCSLLQLAQCNIGAL